MYFAVWWKNLLLSERELKLFWRNISRNWNVFFFDTDSFDKTKNLAWFTKVWRLVSKNKIDLSPYKIIWTNIRLSREQKQELWIKRYKELDLIKTDLEVKNKWKEIIFFSKFKDMLGIVDFYQNIDLYESVDFSKPVRSMEIWMMPSKLTHLLLNLSVWVQTWKTVYDPFVWLWTTPMISNFFEQNVISSDINITPFKQNRRWFMQTEFYKKDFKSHSFKQDVLKFKNNNILNYTTNVVSEWFLWPVVSKFLQRKEAENLEKSFQNIYITWIKNLLKLPNIENIVITFPSYRLVNRDFYIFENSFDQLTKLWADIEVLPEIYYRKWQKVWRQILIIKKP